MRKRQSLIGDSLALLSAADRRKYWVAVGLQMGTSVLDLLGILMVGMVGALAAAAAAGAPTPAALQSVFNALGVGDVPQVKLAIVLASVGAALLIIKGLLNLYINWRTGRFLARCAAKFSSQLSKRFFSLPLYLVQQNPAVRSNYGLGAGVNATVIDVLANAMVIRSEVSLLVLLGLGLLLLDPVTTVLVMLYFALVAFSISRTMRGFARRNGEVITESEIESNKAVHDAVSTYREVTVAGRRDYYTKRYSALRRASTRASADYQFIQRMPRYVMEIAMVFGAALLVLTLSLTRATDAAIASLTLFLVASSRIMPSLLRLNGARLAAHGLQAKRERTYELIALCDSYQDTGARVSSLTAIPAMPETSEHPDMTVDAANLTVMYPASEEPALRDVSFHLPAGKHMALVGPSGAGKSTLVDALLGVVDPLAGEVRVAGLPVPQIIAARPGAISYVPQDVALVAGSVRENVALGVEPDQIDDEQVWKALASASLADFLLASRDGLDTAVGDRGVRLSGGQRQRLGIARALYSNPGLIVLDEATSALDAETEHVVTNVLNGVGDDVTTVTVAHRLATVRHADVILYLEDGGVLARGTFDEVRDCVPQFDRQASLLGL